MGTEERDHRRRRLGQTQREREPELPLARPQAEWKRREPSRFYASVLALRKAGKSVYRQGGQHVVAGTIGTARELLRMAGAGKP